MKVLQISAYHTNFINSHVPKQFHFDIIQFQNGYFCVFWQRFAWLQASNANQGLKYPIHTWLLAAFAFYMAKACIDKWNSLNLHCFKKILSIKKTVLHKNSRHLIFYKNFSIFLLNTTFVETV